MNLHCKHIEDNSLPFIERAKFSSIFFVVVDIFDTPTHIHTHAALIMSRRAIIFDCWFCSLSHLINDTINSLNTRNVVASRI